MKYTVTRPFEIDPSRPNAHKNLGISLAGQSQYREAAQCFVTATQVNAADPRALRLLLMGWDTANIHLGTPTTVGRVRQDLKKRPLKWLPKATEAMAQATIDDWKKWPKA